MVRFSKLILNINIYDEFVGFLSKLVWKKTLFFSILHMIGRDTFANI